MSLFGRFLDALLSPFRRKRPIAPPVAEPVAPPPEPPHEPGAAAPEPPPVPEPPPPPPLIEPALVLAPETAYVPGAPLVELEEEAGLDPDEEEDEGVTDVFDEPSLDRRVEERLAQTPRLRSEAHALALSGEHRISMSDPAGPGSLAEALAELEREGRVACEVSQDEEGAPCLLYRPATPPDAIPTPS